MKTVALIFLFLVSNFSANACDYIVKDQKVSQFVSGKTIFWGRATQAKWDRKRNVNENIFRPNIYNIVEVIKPLKGHVGKKVKVWSDPSSCGTYTPLGMTVLFIVEPYQHNDFYENQLISRGASSASIIAYFHEGIDVNAKASLHAPYISEEKYETKCKVNEKSELPNSCIPKETLDKLYQIYEKESDEVEKLANKKPWWHIKRYR